MSYSVAITVPAGRVASTLTGFVTRVDLAHMTLGWWADVAADGSDIRVRQAGSDVPFYVSWINATTKRGELWFKATLTTAEAVFTIEVVDGATTPAVTDVIGRNAVFSGYDLFVLPGLAYTNLTGGNSPSAVGSIATLGPVSRSPVIPAHQGITQDADGNWYGIDTDDIRKYDADWNLLLTRSGANAATGLGTNHLGDGFVYNGELFTVIETYPDAPYDNVHVAVWNLTDLTFNRSYNLSAQAHEASAITRNPNNGNWYITDYTDTGDSALRQYDASFNYVGTVALSAAISNQQGIEYHNGSFYIASGDLERIYRCNLDGTAVTYVLNADLDPAATSGTELEGLHSDGTDLFVLYDHGASSRVYRLVENGADGVWLDLRGHLKATGLTKRTDWTMGVSALLGRDLESSAGNNAVLSYGTNNSTSANHATLVADYISGGGHKYGIWNSTDSWLYHPTLVPAQFDRYRFHHTQQNTVDRRLWVNGALAATDVGASQRPASTGDTLFIGTNTTAATENFYGLLNWVYLRNGVLSADWLAAEYQSWESPASFYSVPSDITLAGEPAAAAAGALDGTPVMPILISGDPAAAAAVALDGSLPGAGPVLVAGDPAVATAVALDGTGRLRVPGDPAVATTTALDGAIPGAPVVVAGEPAAAAAVALMGVLYVTAQADTGDRRNGRTRTGLAYAVVDPALDTHPTREPVRSMAQSVPTPTLVDGRPQ